jgi:hypothetical protein
MLLPACQGMFTAHSITSVIHGQHLMISRSTEQCVCTEFCGNIRKMATKTYQLMEIAFGDATMS